MATSRRPKGSAIAAAAAAAAAASAATRRNVRQVQEERLVEDLAALCRNPVPYHVRAVVLVRVRGCVGAGAGSDVCGQWMRTGIFVLVFGFCVRIPFRGIFRRVPR